MLDASPTARALLALELLQARPGMTAAELGRRLGVSERAARRYVAILQEAGLPVESTRGRYGGYRVGRGLRLPPLVFSGSEALGLVMAVLDGHHAADDPTSPVGAALGKILAALPANVARPAAQLRAHAASAPNRVAVPPDPAITSALIDAVAGQQVVRLGYRNEGGRSWHEDVEPWAVVVRYGLWYLLCHSRRAEAVRTYRVDRVHEVVATADRFDLPPELDPVAALEEHLGVGWALETDVVFDAPLAEVRPYLSPHTGRLSAVADDPTRCRLQGSTNNAEGYASEWLAPVPFGFTVVGGPELRAAVATLAARFAHAAGGADA